MMDESRDEDPQQDQPTDAVNRREFIGKVAALGGAFVGLAALASVADAAPLTVPQIRLAPAVGAPQLSQAYLKIKNAGAAGPHASAAWAGPVAGLSAPDRIGAVGILEFSQRDPQAHDIGGALSKLFGYLAAGMAARGVHPGADAGGFGCGSGCGTGCASSDAGGFGCGSGCGTGCGSSGLGNSATGNVCGIGCSGLHPGSFAIDVEGTALPGVQLRGLNLSQLSASLLRAQQAYLQTFH